LNTLSCRLNIFKLGLLRLAFVLRARLERTREGEEGEGEIHAWIELRKGTNLKWIRMDGWDWEWTR